MSFKWIHEQPAYWDEPKAAIIGDAPVGVFDARFGRCKIGERLPAEWWRVEEDGKVVGYGWLDVVWGDAEILLATAPGARGHGAGQFIVEHLENEARAKGLNYLYNVVRPTHPEREVVTSWLKKRGFTASEDGSLLRAVAKKSD